MNTDTIIYQERPAWRDQISIILGAIVLTCLLIFYTSETVRITIFPIWAIFMLVLILYVVVKRCSWKYTVTTNLIESVNGILSKNTRSIRVCDLRSVNVKQGIIQRFMNIGDIEFGSAGSGGIEVTFSGVANPGKVRNDVYALMKGDLLGKNERNVDNNECSEKRDTQDQDKMHQIMMDGNSD